MAIKGSCHCGANRFEIDAAPQSATRCTCTICAKKGALYAYFKPDQVKFETPTSFATYRWQSKMVAHNFCPTCGCATYNQSPSWVDYKPDFANPQIAINVRLLDDFDVETLPVEVIDGRNLW